MKKMKKNKQPDWSVTRNEYEMNVEYAQTIKRLYQALMPVSVVAAIFLFQSQMKQKTV